MMHWLSRRYVCATVLGSLMAGTGLSSVAAEMGPPDCRSVSYKIEVGEATPACRLPGFAEERKGVQGPIRTDEMMPMTEKVGGHQQSPSAGHDFFDRTLTP